MKNNYINIKRKEKPVFNCYEKEIIRKLASFRYFKSINNLAKECNMSWITTKKYVDKLMNLGVIIKYNNSYYISEWAIKEGG